MEGDGEFSVGRNDLRFTPRSQLQRNETSLRQGSDRIIVSNKILVGLQVGTQPFRLTNNVDDLQIIERVLHLVQLRLIRLLIPVNGGFFGGCERTIGIKHEHAVDGPVRAINRNGGRVVAGQGDATETERRVVVFDLDLANVDTAELQQVLFDPVFEPRAQRRIIESNDVDRILTRLPNIDLSFFPFDGIADDQRGDRFLRFIFEGHQPADPVVTDFEIFQLRLDDTQAVVILDIFRLDIEDRQSDERVGGISHLLDRIGGIALARGDRPHSCFAILADLKRVELSQHLIEANDSHVGRYKWVLELFEQRTARDRAVGAPIRSRPGNEQGDRQHHDGDAPKDSGLSIFVHGRSLVRPLSQSALTNVFTLAETPRSEHHHTDDQRWNAGENHGGGFHPVLDRGNFLVCQSLDFLDSTFAIPLRFLAFHVECPLLRLLLDLKASQLFLQHGLGNRAVLTFFPQTVDLFAKRLQFRIHVLLSFTDRGIEVLLKLVASQPHLARRLLFDRVDHSEAGEDRFVTANVNVFRFARQPIDGVEDEVNVLKLETKIGDLVGLGPQQ